MTTKKIAIITVSTINIIFFIFLLAYAVPFLGSRQEFLRHHLSGQKWSLPSTIYAEPVTLSEGQTIDQDWLVDYLNNLDYEQQVSGPVHAGSYSVRNDTVSFRSTSSMSTADANSSVIVRFHGSRIEKIETLAGEVLPSVELDPVPISNVFGSQWEKRTLVKYEDVPQHVISAVIAIEDRNFFKHSGIDFNAIGRAALSNSVSDKTQGASTITQQLVKNFYLSSEKTLRRKVHEAILALLIEQELSKEEILEHYLNEVYLGQRGPISVYGIAEASRLYFHKDFKHLTVPEAAMLAGMIQSPNRYNPYKYEEKIKDRRDTVLLAMQKMGTITPEQERTYREAPIQVIEPDRKAKQAPYFVELIRKQMEKKYSPQELSRNDLRIYTTLDLQLQQFAEQALAEGLNDINKVREKRTGKKVEGCLIAIDPKTGYVKAYVGGTNYSQTQLDRITQSLRQPGSTFKPVIYASALESLFTPSSLVDDEPLMVQFGTAVWKPKNYDGNYHGTVTLRQALAKSMNVATARLADQAGLYNVAYFAQRMGFNRVKPYPSMALGSFEVSPWELIRAYTAFPNDGQITEPLTIKSIRDRNSIVMEEARTRTVRAMRPETAYMVTDMMRSVLSSGTAVSARRWGITSAIAAGKTGTTNDFRDAWFVGFTPDLICLVWTGYDDNTPLKMNGAQAALPIWGRFMQKALRIVPASDFVQPAGIVTTEIDPETGKLSTPYCPNVVTEIFATGSEPIEPCEHGMQMEYPEFGIETADIGDESDPTEIPILPVVAAVEDPSRY